MEEDTVSFDASNSMTALLWEMVLILGAGKGQR